MIPPCCLQSLVAWWPVCVAVAERRPKSAITAELLWVLLWAENPVCLSEYPLRRAGPREQEHVANLASELRRLLRAYRSLQCAVLVHRYGSIPDDTRVRCYLHGVFDTVTWAQQTTPWRQPVPPPSPHPTCGKPLPSRLWRLTFPPKGGRSHGIRYRVTPRSNRGS